MVEIYFFKVNMIERYFLLIEKSITMKTTRLENNVQTINEQK